MNPTRGPENWLRRLIAIEAEVTALLLLVPLMIAALAAPFAYPTG